MSEDSATATERPIEEQKEANRLGTINRWESPESDWAAEYDWTRYRGPAPWPVPGGWLFKDPEEGGWWQYFGDLGVGHWDDNKIVDELKEDESVDDAYDALEDARGEYAYLNVETANPDEVSRRNPEDEKLEWRLKIDDTEVFRRVDPDRSDLMGAVAQALHAYHTGDLEDQVDEIVPASGRKPKEIRQQEELKARKESNQSLGDFS